MASERVSILCIGNALHGDDGLGEAVWLRLAELDLPANVRLGRAAFASMAALAGIEGCDRAIVVDALQGFGEPGSVHCLPADAIAAEDSPVGHGAGLGHWLAQLPMWFEPVPSVEVIGVEVAQLNAFVPGLSAVVAAALDQVCERVLERAAHA
jgi:hydrogenase maturation protease